MSKEAKILTVIGVVIAIGVSALIVVGAKDDSKNQPKASGSQLVRDDSYQTNKSAPVTLTEFGDYQCPACGAAQPVIEQLKQAYGPRLNVVFRNLPLVQIHKNAKPSAEAAEAAGAQGKYYEMNSLLYQNQAQWSESVNPITFFVTYAQQLGLDANKLKSDVESLAYDKKIQRDLDDASALNLNSTPSFFVNGQRVESAGQLKAAIEAALKTAAPVPAK